MRKFLVQTGALLGLMLCFGFLANAQIIPDALSLIASPSSPSPDEIVTIQAATPTFEKNSAFFSWTVEGKERPDLSGAGQDVIKISAGGLGSSLRVSVLVLRDNADALSAALTVRIADLALSWFAQTYVPRWYKGKALPIQNSNVTMVAVPNIIIEGATLRPAELIYRWRLDEEDEISGVGLDVFRIKTSDLPRSSHRIRVVVEDSGKQIKKEGELFIVPTTPSIFIYQSSPLGGIENRSSLSFKTSPGGNLLDFWAEPFFFNALSRQNLSYRWTVGTTEVTGGVENPYLLTLDPGKQPTGIVPVSVSADDSDAFTPSASAFLNLLLQ